MPLFTPALTLVVGAIVGFIVRSKFDNRDLRREILDEPWKGYVSMVAEVKEEFRRLHVDFANLTSSTQDFEPLAKKIRESELFLVDAAKRIQDKVLVKRVEDATEHLHRAYVGYCVYISRYNLMDPNERNDAAHKTDTAMDSVTAALELIYERYWQLCTRVFWAYR